MPLQRLALISLTYSSSTYFYETHFFLFCILLFWFAGRNLPQGPGAIRFRNACYH